MAINLHIFDSGKHTKFKESALWKNPNRHFSRRLHGMGFFGLHSSVNSSYFPLELTDSNFSRIYDILKGEGILVKYHRKMGVYSWAVGLDRRHFGFRMVDQNKGEAGALDIADPTT